MIIELFGPPGAGKTIFAHALAARLREAGHTVVLMLSYRPAEEAPSADARVPRPPHRRVAVIAVRVVRPFVEMLRIACNPVDSLHHIGIAVTLLRTIRPRSLLWSLRIGQYIFRLSHAWRLASQVNHIVLFDQGFAQVVCSLDLLGRVRDEALVAHALDFAPKADLLIRLDAPCEVLEARLRERQGRQGVLERLFEISVSANLETRPIIDRLHALLWQRGQLVINVTSLDGCSLRESVEQAWDRIDQRCAGQAVVDTMNRCCGQPRGPNRAIVEQHVVREHEAMASFGATGAQSETAVRNT